MELTAYQRVTTMLIIPSLMSYAVVFFLASIILSKLLFKFDTNTRIGRFVNTITFSRLVFILQMHLESVMDIPDIVRVFTTFFAGIIDMYSKTMEFQTMNTRLLATIDENGVLLIRHGPERQEIQSLQKYTFIFLKILMVGAIVSVAIGIPLIAGIIYFGSWVISK